MINLGKKSINLKNSKKNDLEKKGKRWGNVGMFSLFY